MALSDYGSTYLLLHMGVPVPHTQATQTSLVVCLFHRMPVVHKNIKNEYAHLDIDSKRIKPEEDTWYINLTDKQISEIQIGDQEDHLSIKIDWAAGHIVADRSTLKHQFSTEYGIQREVSMSEELKNIEIYYDNTFIEIYLNDGKDTMTLRAFPENVEINLI